MKSVRGSLGCWIPFQFPALTEDCGSLLFLRVYPQINKHLLCSILGYCGTLLFANKMVPMWSESMPLLGPAQAPTTFSHTTRLNYPL